MKTLYININSERIESSDTIEVLAYDLINDFYFTLGEKLLLRCPIADVDKIKLFTEYMDTCDASGADSILEQWSQLKAQLFGEYLQGTFTIHLPDSYLSWLKYNENPDYCRLAEKLSLCIDLDLEEFYEDSIEPLQRRIFRYLQKEDRYKEIDEIVFNDYAVVRKSEIIRQIKVKYADIKFVAYEKWMSLSAHEKKEQASTIRCSTKGFDNIVALYDNDECIVIILDIETGSQSQYERLTESVCKHYYKGRYDYDTYNTLLLYKPEDGYLYFFSKYSGLVKIGVYNTDYNDEQEYFMSKDGYLLYRNGVQYKIYKCSEEGLVLKWEFGCHVSFEFPYYGEFMTIHSMGRYLAVNCDDIIRALDLETGQIVNCKANHLPIAYDNGEYIYIHGWEENSYPEIVTQSGLVLYSGELEVDDGFDYFKFSNAEGKVGLLDAYGKVILGCKYEDLKRYGDIFLLPKREYDSNEIFIPSKNKWVYEVWEDKYLVMNNDDSLSLYNKDDICLYRRIIGGEFIPTGLPKDHIIIGTERGKDDVWTVFSKSSGKRLLDVDMEDIAYSPNPDAAFPYSDEDIERFAVKNGTLHTMTVYDMCGNKLYEVEHFDEHCLRFSKSGYIAYFNDTSEWGYFDKNGRKYSNKWSSYEDPSVFDAYVFSDHLVVLFTGDDASYNYYCNIINEGKIQWRLSGRRSIVVYSDKIMAIYPDQGGTILLNHSGEEIMRSPNFISFIKK